MEGTFGVTRIERPPFPFPEAPLVVVVTLEPNGGPEAVYDVMTYRFGKPAEIVEKNIHFADEAGIESAIASRFPTFRRAAYPVEREKRWPAGIYQIWLPNDEARAALN